MKLKLSHLSHKQRRLLTVGILVGTGLLCYVLITHGSIRQLHQAHLEKKAMEKQQQGLTLVNAELLAAEKLLTKTQKDLQAQQIQCCTLTQAEVFFEQMTTWAQDYHLTPISQVISTLQPVEDLNGSTLVSQGANLVLQGNVYDLIDFMSMLVERPHKVCITNLHVALPPGEAFKPRASFRVVLVIDPTSEG